MPSPPILVSPPLQTDIVIKNTLVYVNPFSEEALAADAAERKVVESKEAEKKEFGSWLSNPAAAFAPKGTEVKGSSVGKYITAYATAHPQVKRVKPNPTQPNSLRSKSIPSSSIPSSALLSPNRLEV